MNLAECYYKGRGVKQDYKEAMKWYHKAADQGDADALYELGLFYYEGRGVKQDYKEAVKWFKKAGNSGAKYYLGLCYYNGHGVSVDKEEAWRCWYEAKERNNEDAAKALQEYFNYEE